MIGQMRSGERFVRAATYSGNRVWNAVVKGTLCLRHHARAMLEAQYPEAIFLGTRQGAELASIYASADVFVFPSKTDTFGLVILEALACGTPVAGYPVQGPLDIIGVECLGPNRELKRPIGSLNEDLSQAIQDALRLDRADAAYYGATFCWDACTGQFLNGIPRTETAEALAA